MAKKRKIRSKNLIGFVCIGITAILIYTFGVHAYRVYNESQEYAALVEKRDSFIAENEDLAEEVELLNDDDYVIHYARGKYNFSKDGEEVVKLPDSKE